MRFTLVFTRGQLRYEESERRAACGESLSAEVAVRERNPRTTYRIQCAIEVEHFGGIVVPVTSGAC